MRHVFGVILGLVVGVAVIIAVEGLSVVLFPLPSTVDPTDQAQLAAAVASMPLSAKLFVLLAWFLGTSLGAAVATWVARRQPITAYLVGALFLVSGILNLSMVPHPVWFWFPGLLVFPVGAFLGSRVLRSPRVQMV